MLALVARATESWFPLALQRSAQDEAEQLDRLLHAASVAAEAGCTRVWLSAPRELAAENDSLRLAVAVVLHCPTLRVVATGLRAESEAASWIRLAEDAATADGLCGGRLELAFAQLPEVRTLERLRAAWSGAPVQLPKNGETEAATIEVHPHPVHPDGPPLWVEAADPADAARAAELELGAIVADAASARAHAEAAADGLPLPVAVVEASPDEISDLPPNAISLSRLALD